MTINNLKKHVIFFGPPACGKGTQSLILRQNQPYDLIATGDVIRQEIASDSTIGRNLKSIIDAGKLVDDETIYNMISAKIAESINNKNLILFDGFPRTVEQSKFLVAMLYKKICLKSQNNHITDLEISEILEKFSAEIKTFLQKTLTLIVFKTNDETLIQRVVNRVSCNQCKQIYNLKLSPPKIHNVCDKCGSTDIIKRSDDTEIIAHNRIANYHKETSPIIAFFKKFGIIVEIDGEDSVENITTHITAHIL